VLGNKRHIRTNFDADAKSQATDAFHAHSFPSVTFRVLAIFGSL
jgi:hypothetical protein